MRIGGFILLILGFLSACAAAFLLQVGSTAVASRMLQLTERKESFTKDEVFTIIVEQGQRSRPSFLWTLTPAAMMLAGGVLIAFRKR